MGGIGEGTFAPVWLVCHICSRHVPPATDADPGAAAAARMVELKTKLKDPDM